MFTDDPVTPTKVETLLDLLRNTRRKFDRDTLLKVFQPEELPAVRSDSSRLQAKRTIKAASELGLIADSSDGAIELAIECPSSKSSREVLLDALDRIVLGAVEVEPYFAPFYSYLLFLGPQALVDRNGNDWSIAFERDVHGGQRTDNPFNDPKYTGLHRWYAYAGLGWYGPSGIFQPVPTERLSRRLSAIFGEEPRLSIVAFMDRLSDACPELDGGKIFSDTNRDYQPEGQTCTLGLSQALIELHEDGVIVLECPRDARGWSIKAAAPPNDGEFLVSDRIDFVQLKSTE